MKKIIFLIDLNFIDYYKETIDSITKSLKPGAYEIREYRNLKHLDIRKDGEKDYIYYNFCTTHPLKDVIFKILSKRNLINPLESQEICFDKRKSDMVFRRFRLPAPPAISTINSEEVNRFLSNNEKVIFKERMSCSGMGHFIVDKKYAHIGNKKLLLKISNEKGSLDFNVKIEGNKLICKPPFYIQSFLKPDKPEVWRLYLVGGEIVFLSKRYRDNITIESDYVINAARGAKYLLEDEVSAINRYKNSIKKAITDLKLKVATIDFIIHDEQPYFLEMDCDGIYTFICRGFKNARNYEKRYNLDLHIAKMLIS